MTTVTPIRIAHEITDRPALLLAFEWSVNPWKLGFTPGSCPTPPGTPCTGTPSRGSPGGNAPSQGTLWVAGGRPGHQL
jgi:hypothetical protein